MIDFFLSRVGARKVAQDGRVIPAPRLAASLGEDLKEEDFDDIPG
jgi:hypothetical protein